MSGERERPPVIDADGHVTEPPTLWENYLDARFRERAPRFALSSDGQPCEIADGREIMRLAMRLTLPPGYPEVPQRLRDLDSEGYFRRQCVVSTEPGEQAVDAVVAHVGEDNVVWASDYPHPDATFPGAVTKTLAAVATLSDAARRKILAANAARFYGLAVPGRG
jgi:hypothetical protein